MEDSMPRPSRVVLSGVAAALLAACAAEGSTGPGIDPPASATGTIALTMRADGPALDPDGYTVRVDGVERGGVAVKGTTWIRAVAAGTTELHLEDVEPGCTVVGGNPRTVAVPAGDILRTSVSVICDGNGQTAP
jgi:hypothetical protein